jgi:hypothetical protein
MLMAQLAGQLGQQSNNLANANSPEQDKKLLTITPIKPTNRNGNKNKWQEVKQFRLRYLLKK